MDVTQCFICLWTRHPVSSTLLPLQAVRSTAGQTFRLVWVRERCRGVREWEGGRGVSRSLQTLWLTAGSLLQTKQGKRGHADRWRAALSVCHVIHQCKSVYPLVKVMLVGRSVGRSDGLSVCLSVWGGDMCLIIYTCTVQSFRSSLPLL